MQQGRRTASLKASYDAVNLGIHPAEFSVGRELLTNNELHQAAQQALAATGCGGAEQKRNKRFVLVDTIFLIYHLFYGLN